MDKHLIKKEAWDFTKKNFANIYKGLIFGVLISLILTGIYTYILKDAILNAHVEIIKVQKYASIYDTIGSVVASLSLYNLLALPFSVGGLRSYLAIYNLFVGNFPLLAKGIILVVSLALIPMSYGVTRYLLELIKGNKPKVFKNIFYYYKHNILQVMVLSLVASAALFLGLQLFLFPVIFAYIVFAMSKEIYIENNTSYLKCIKDNYEFMKGYKWNYFNYLISFIGWFLLSIFTFGIALIWVVPYVSVAKKMYFLKVKELKG